MPTLSTFFGIVVTMYFYDTNQHHLPHIHVKYGEHKAVLGIPGGALIDGDLPSRQMKLVAAWVELRQDELMANWDRAVNGNPVAPIAPLR